MYRAHVTRAAPAGPGPSLDLLDDALLRLRRLWSASRQRLVDDRGVAVEMSSLLVVEACARGAAAAREVCVADVAAFADITPSTASRVVERAAAARLVARGTSAVDPRRTAVSLTAGGAALQARAYAARTTWLAGRVESWSADDVHDLAALLARFADTLDRTAQPFPSADTQPPRTRAVGGSS